MLFYVPLESYAERYTSQLSTEKTGWFERNWIKRGVDYERVDSIKNMQGKVGPIKQGQVLDASQRAQHCFNQIEYLIRLIPDGTLSEKDVIYFDDFWTPGIEQLRYAFDVMGKKPPKMYAYCWAQSVDEYDFTHKMKPWIRAFECGNFAILDGIFVANTLLKELFVLNIAGQYFEDKIHVVGLPFDSQEVISRMRPGFDETKPRENKVIFSSRWDEEKQPLIFCAVAERVIKECPDVKFVVTTSATEFRSNKPQLLKELFCMQEAFPNNFFPKSGLTKEQYYQELCTAKAQFNCALQDWVSFTLLEASVAGCWPVYPKFRSFPETLNNNDNFMYEPWNVAEAADMIINCMKTYDVIWSEGEIEKRAWIHRRMDDTWKRILYHMGLWTEMKAGDNWLEPYEPYIILPKK